MQNISKNSWVLSVKNKSSTKYIYHYICSCSKEFEVQIAMNKPYAPDVVCTKCGNDYFKDADEFRNITGTKIWKYFKWNAVVSEDDEYWNVTLRYEIPIYDEALDTVKFDYEDLLHICLKKDGSIPFSVSYKSKKINRYSLFLDNRVIQFNELLLKEAQKNLYNFILINKSITIKWIDANAIKKLSLSDKLKYITYFLKNSHLQEHRFFFWNMDSIHNHTIEHTTEIAMLNNIVNNRKEKSVKKAIYKGYQGSIESTGYHPYSDYVFSRTIDNIDLLTTLYGIFPAVKEHIFTNGTFPIAIEFIEFLKQHYTQKQIVTLFVKEMQDEAEYKSAIQNWRDTLRMIRELNAFNSLEEHFIKVKLTTKKLHDEIIRVFNLVSYELDSKEKFEYDKTYISACIKYEELEFKLPDSVAELGLWARILHNCMSGYTKTIHQRRTIIYGVFKDDVLLYAVELNGSSIVQAHGKFNALICEEDMESIRGWKRKSLVLNHE